MDGVAASTKVEGESTPGPKFWRPDVPFAPSGVPLFYGWVIVGVATVGWLFSIPGQTMGFSVFTEYLIEELGLSRVALSTAYCAGTVLSGLTLPRLGRLLDRWGERRMTVAASLVTALILFYLSVTVLAVNWLVGMAGVAWRGVIAFVLILVGFFWIRLAAQGVLTMTCRNVMGKWFHFRRGAAMAISGVLVSFGFALAPKVLDELIQRFGHAGTWMLLGLLTALVMAPLGWLLVRDDPEACGLVMDGAAVKPPRRDNPDMRMVKEYSRDEAVATYSFWVFNLSFAFYGLFATAFTFHIVSMGAQFGFERAAILTLFVPMAAISVSTNLFFGWINTRVRLKALLGVMNLGCALAAAGMIFLDRPIGVAAYVLGNGLAGGGFVNLSGVVWPRFFGRRHLGAISGVNMSTMVIASGLGPLLFGGAVQLTGSYRPALALSTAVALALLISSARADNPQRTASPNS